MPPCRLLLRPRLFSLSLASPSSLLSVRRREREKVEEKQRMEVHDDDAMKTLRARTYPCTHNLCVRVTLFAAIGMWVGDSHRGGGAPARVPQRASAAAATDAFQNHTGRGRDR